MKDWNLAKKLAAYLPKNTFEQQFKVRMLDLFNTYDNAFERSLLIGHFTGSAWIVNSTGTKALLTHHRKLNRWLQLGGHCDGETNVEKVAYKEALEESGLQSLKLWSTNIFDIDIHPIPAKGNIPEHEHFDVRFLFTADDNESLVVSSESINLQWVQLSDIAKLTERNESILRMVQKTQALFA